MSRRTANLHKLSGAAGAAIAADAWIAAPQRSRALAAACHDTLDEAVIERVCKTSRIASRLGNRVAPLLALSLAYPVLAPWLSAPRGLRKLSRCAGAALAGGALSRLITKDDLNAVSQSIGADALRFGLAERGDNLPMIASAADIIAFIETQGEQGVGEYLHAIAPDLAPDIMCAAGLSCDPDYKTNAPARAKALAAALEKVRP